MSSSTVERALAKMAEIKALVVGDLVLDTYLFGETVRISREAPVPVVRTERTEHRLGGAANAAANLAALDVKVAIAGVLGDDDAGRTVSRMLVERAIDVSGLFATNTTTPQKTRVLAGAFGTARQQVLRLDQEPEGPLAGRAAGQLARSLGELGRHFDVIVVSDYGAGFVPDEVISVCRQLASQGKPVCVDSRYRLGDFVGVTMVKPNAPEAGALVGADLKNVAAFDAAGRAILQRLNCELCLLTRGRGGMSLFARGCDPTHEPVVGSEEVTDVTGAGDTVIASFAAALASGIGPVNAMRIANCAAGVTVMKAGAAVASPAEIVQAARTYHVEMEPWDE